jgi:hypothetical protein
MSKIVLGLIAGLVFGALDVALMLPMSFPDKTTALLGAFASRFGIGFVIGCVQLLRGPDGSLDLFLVCSSVFLTPSLHISISLS